jgi:modulator of FtsH protease
MHVAGNGLATPVLVKHKGLLKHMEQQNLNTYGFGKGASADYALQRNRVLRNTYWLLALTMVPTVLGAWLGVALRLPMPSGLIGFVIFMAVAFGFVWAIEKNKNSGLGVALLLGFTFIMGLFLSRILQVYLALPSGPQLIATAAAGTGFMFMALGAYATTTKRDFSNMGKFLFIGVIMLIVAIVANYFLKLPALALTISVIGFGIFSAYLLYDLSRIVNGGETNYVSATLAVYLDLFNIFQFLLSILGLTNNNE